MNAYIWLLIYFTWIYRSIVFENYKGMAGNTLSSNINSIFSQMTSWPVYSITCNVCVLVCLYHSSQDYNTL